MSRYRSCATGPNELSGCSASRIWDSDQIDGWAAGWQTAVRCVLGAHPGRATERRPATDPPVPGACRQGLYVAEPDCTFDPQAMLYVRTEGYLVMQHRLRRLGMRNI